MINMTRKGNGCLHHHPDNLWRDAAAAGSRGLPGAPLVIWPTTRPALSGSRPGLRPIFPRIALAPAPALVDVAQQIGRVIIDAECAGVAQLVGAVAAAEQPDPERLAARCGQDVPDTVADHHCGLDRCADP